MIESRYWKEDLLNYVVKFKPVKNPPRYTEKRQVNFEKDIIISLFMVRKLSDSLKISMETLKTQFEIYSSPAMIKVHNMNFWDIGSIYNFEKEKKTLKDIRFISNQLIHGQAIYAYRDESRNWAGLYTCSDFERSKNIFRIPLSTIIDILELVAEDYPSALRYEYCDKADDYLVTINR